MSIRYYHLLAALAASVSLLTAGCGTDRADGNAAEPPPPAQTAAQTAGQTAASSQPDELDTESNIWMVLGMAKRPSQRAKGPQIGNEVSPILWEASHDALNFVRVASEDPLTGVVLTEWYSPPGKPTERMRISVFILSRALRSDSVSVTIDRQERLPTGEWKSAPIAREAVGELESAILLRARHIRAERYRDTS
jgi:Domain of unknown function (DUF3576)